MGYRVGEVLFGQHNTAVGRTKDITGQLTVAGTTVTSASFTVDMTTVNSDESQRDAQFQGRIMDTATYPTATFRLTKAAHFGSLPLGTVRSGTAAGELTLRGKTEPVGVPLQIERTGPTVAVLGSVNIVFAKWSIPNPSFAGLVTTNDHGILEFLLSFEKGTAPATTTTPVSAAPATSHPSGGRPNGRAPPAAARAAPGEGRLPVAGEGLSAHGAEDDRARAHPTESSLSRDRHEQGDERDHVGPVGRRRCVTLPMSNCRGSLEDCSGQGDKDVVTMPGLSRFVAHTIKAGLVSSVGKRNPEPLSELQGWRGRVVSRHTPRKGKQYET